MNPTMTADTYEQLSIFSERKFPAAPFPRKYVHSVFDDLQDAVQAVQALQTAGYDARDIHLMASWDYREAVERRQAPMGFLSSIDEAFVDRAFVLSPGLARLRRANKLLCVVEHARSACSTKHNNSGERRRCEQASGMASSQTFMQIGDKDGNETEKL